MSLRAELSQHRENLRTLQLQAAQHGTDVPLGLVNQIRHEEQAVERIEQELAAEDIEAYAAARPQVGDDMTEARLANNEITLHRMDQKIDKMSDLMRTLDTRLTTVEVRFDEMRREMHEVRSELERIRGGVGLPRLYVAASAIALVIMLALMILLTWRAL